MRNAITAFIINNLLGISKLKKYCLVFALLLSNIFVIANSSLVTQRQLGMFKNSITCIVADNSILFYNSAIKEAIETYWKITDYEFIGHLQFEQRKHDSKYSFLIVFKGVFDKDPGGVSYNFISLVLGDDTDNITQMPEICSIPLSYSENNSMEYGYVIPAIVKFMQIHASNLENHRFMISLKGLKYYNGSRSLKGKELLLNKNKMALDANSLEKINVVYPYYIRILSDSIIQVELSSRPANTLFGFHVGPTSESSVGQCFELVFDVYGNLYYYHYRKITNVNGDGFNLKDFKRIKRCAFRI